MTTLTLTNEAPANADVTCVFASTKNKTAHVLSKVGTPSVDTKLTAALKDLGFSGKAGEVATVAGSSIGASGKLLVVGVGSDATHETFRRAAGNAARAANGAKKLAIAVPADSADAAGAIAEGALLGAYTFNQYRSASNSPARQSVKAIAVVCAEAKNAVVKSAVKRAVTVANATNASRDLTNTSPLDLPPAKMAEAAAAIAEEHGLAIEVLDEKAMAKLGMGGILGVGQGSSRGPRLIRLAYRPAGAVGHLAIVGKGITFDTGGISLKPPANMHEMKGDMSGAAAVLNTIGAIAALKLNINVTAYAACAENMPGGKAQRPGDVVTAYGGRTVEVLNTDAEGRLVLMDALVRAQEDKPDIIIDVATLTGAAVVALGARISAVLGNDDALRNHIVDAGSRSGESFWPLPLPAELRPELDSMVADIANIGTPMQAGTLFGGLFLLDFIEQGQRWAHLDIAGPAFNSKGAYDYTPRGGTGTAVRTLVTVAEDMIAGLI